MALSAIGTRSTIASLDEASTEASVCQLWYAQTRDGLLRKFPWNWARRQVVLAVYKSAAGTPENPTGALPEPPLPWRYSYSWPTDCLDARYLLPVLVRNGSQISPPLTTGQTSFVPPQRTPPIKFIVAGDRDNQNNPLKVILTNQPIAQLVYTGYVNDPNVWDQNFIDAMIGRLAQRISFPLSGDKTLTQIAIKAGAQAEADAEAQNGNETTNTNVWTPDWLSARGYCDITPDESDNYTSGGQQDIT